MNKDDDEDDEANSKRGRVEIVAYARSPQLGLGFNMRTGTDRARGNKHLLSVDSSFNIARSLVLFSPSEMNYARQIDLFFQAQAIILNKL